MESLKNNRNQASHQVSRANSYLKFITTITTILAMVYFLVSRWPKSKSSKISKEKKIINRKNWPQLGYHNITGRNKDQVALMSHLILKVSWRMVQQDHPVLNIIKDLCLEFIKCKSNLISKLLIYSLQIKVWTTAWENLLNHLQETNNNKKPIYLTLVAEKMQVLNNNPNKTKSKTLLT